MNCIHVRQLLSGIITLPVALVPVQYAGHVFQPPRQFKRPRTHRIPAEICAKVFDRLGGNHVRIRCGKQAQKRRKRLLQFKLNSIETTGDQALPFA